MRWTLVLFIFVLILSSLLRIEGGITKSFAFTYDVGRDLLELQNIASTGKLPLIGQTTGLPGLFYGPWWYYALFPAFLLSLGNPVGIALFMSLTGVVTVCLGYILGKRIENANFGLLFASFLGLSPVMVGIATQIWNPNLAPLYVMFFFFCFYKIIDTSNKKKSLFWFAFLGVLFGLIIDSEIVFGMLFSLGIFLSFLFLFKKTYEIKNYSFIAIGFFIVLLPRIIFELRHNFLMTNSILSVLSNTLSHHGGKISSFKPLVAFISLEKLWNYTLARDNVLFGVLLLLGTFLGVVFFYKKTHGNKKMFLQMILFILLTFFLGLSLFPGDIWGHYTVGIPVLYIFVFSFAIYKTIMYFKQTKIFVIILVVVLLIINLNPIQLIDTIKNPYWEGNVSLYRNQIGVVDYIYKKANKAKFNYAVYTPPIYDYPYQYIFLWYGNKTYGYVPSKEKASLFFLIMEPDKQNPSRLQAWYKVRQNDGQIQENKALPGEISVQTRTH